MFLRLLFHTVVRAVVRKQILDGAKNLNDLTENKTLQFFTCIAKLRTLDDGL
jgi:hypothetical protein